MNKYKYEDLEIGMQVTKAELEEIEYVWMLVKYQHQPEDYKATDYGTLVYFEKENPSNQSIDIKNRISAYIANTKIDEDGFYEEFWGVYLNGYLNKKPLKGRIKNYSQQIISTAIIPEGEYEITIVTSFGKWTNKLKTPEEHTRESMKLQKLAINDLKIGMQTRKEKLEDIEHVWMLIKYLHEADKYGTLVYFEKENPSNQSIDIRNRITTYIANTKIDENGTYKEFWGIYLNGYLNKDLPFEEVENYVDQVMSTIAIPKGQFKITVDTPFGSLIKNRMKPRECESEIVEFSDLVFNESDNWDDWEDLKL